MRHLRCKLSLQIWAQACEPQSATRAWQTRIKKAAPKKRRF